MYIVESISAEDEARVKKRDWFVARASEKCTTCKKEYSDHPHVTGARWLRRLCNNILVKI